MGYDFKVPWDSLPEDLVKSLTKNEQEKKRAAQEDINTLKLAIAKKLVSSYKAYKEGHPNSNKHPGVKVYNSVTEQVTLEVSNYSLRG